MSRRYTSPPLRLRRCVAGLLFLGFVVIAEGLDMIRLRGVATDYNTKYSGKLSFTKEIWLGGCLGIQPRGMGTIWPKASAT
jgi:hypothetical protein